MKWRVYEETGKRQQVHLDDYTFGEGTDLPEFHMNRVSFLGQFVLVVVSRKADPLMKEYSVARNAAFNGMQHSQQNSNR